MQVLYQTLGEDLLNLVHEFVGDFMGAVVNEWSSKYHMMVSSTNQLLAYQPETGDYELKRDLHMEWGVLPRPFKLTCTGYQTFLQSFEFVDVDGVDWLSASEWPLQASPVLMHRDVILLYADGLIYAADLLNEPIILRNVHLPISVSRIEHDAFLVTHLRGSAVVYIPRLGMLSVRHTVSEQFSCTRGLFSISTEGELYCEFNMSDVELPLLPTDAWIIGVLQRTRTLILFDGRDLIGLSLRSGQLQRYRLAPGHLPQIYNDQVHVYNGQSIKVLL